MDKVYAVYHNWEEGYYKAKFWKQQIICAFDSLEKAEEFKAKYEIKYGTGSQKWFRKGVLTIEEIPMTYDESTFWWINDSKDPQMFFEKR